MTYLATYQKFSLRSLVYFALHQIKVKPISIFHAKYQSNVWLCLAKVVDFLTRKLTKLVWHFSEFSMIFYDVSKI
jgi:hypothetical protein